MENSKFGQRKTGDPLQVQAARLHAASVDEQLSYCMKFKNISTLSVLLMLTGWNFAQTLVITPTFADSMEKVDKKLAWELQAILLYNDAVKTFGYTDTIRITKAGGLYYYFYQDSVITDLQFNFSGKQSLVALDYARSTNWVFLHSSTLQSPANKFELYVREASFDRNDLVYKLSNYLNDVQNGRYEERTKSGKIIVAGQYCQMDTMYVDTLASYDRETYEEIPEIIPRTKYAIKSGVWYYYSPEGILVRVEKNKTCK